MVSPFVTVIERLRDIGAFQFLFPFMLTSAIFYGLLRKTKLFGEPEKNVAVNAVVALIAAFMVWAAPILLGIDIETALSKFFVQGLVATLVPLLGLLIVGMFMPEGLTTELKEAFKGKYLIGLVIVFILVIAGVAVASGLVGALFPGVTIPGIPSDWLLTAGMIAVLIIILAIIIFVGGK
jgi:hypothetical protein